MGFLLNLVVEEGRGGGGVSSLLSSLFLSIVPSNAAGDCIWLCLFTFWNCFSLASSPTRVVAVIGTVDQIRVGR